MTAVLIVAAVLVLVLVALVIAQLPEIRRYMKIRAM
jgi:hypothetical protein